MNYCDWDDEDEDDVDYDGYYDWDYDWDCWDEWMVNGSDEGEL